LARNSNYCCGCSPDIGPKKIPEFGAALGKTLRDLKKKSIKMIKKLKTVTKDEIDFALMKLRYSSYQLSVLSIK